MDSPAQLQSPHGASLPAEHTFALDDRRRVQLLELGARDGVPVLALHGTPGSRLRFAPAHSHALAAGIRLIATDRWGYGGSDAPASPTLEIYARDLAAIADHLGIQRFALLGVSGGGPFAAKAAAALGNRVTRVALVSPVGPICGRHRHTAGTFHRFCFLTLPRIPGGLRAVFGAHRALALARPAWAAALAAGRAPVADQEILAQGENRRALGEAFAAGFSPGTLGARIDMRLFSSAWSVRSTGMAESRLWIGDMDRNVPIGAARLLALETGAEMITITGAGHMWLTTAWREVFDWLAAGTGPAPRTADTAQAE